MNSTVLVLKNLTRNWVRTGLTVAAVALPMALFLLTTALKDVLDDVLIKAQKELRLGVHNRVSIINPLREGMRRDIEALDPDGKSITTETLPDGQVVKAVCGMKWFGGQIKDVPGVIPALAGDKDTWFLVYSDYELSAEEKQAWLANKTAAVVGHNTAEKFGWKEGQKIRMSSAIPPYLEMEFTVIKVAYKGRDPNVVYFRRDYLDDALKEKLPQRDWDTAAGPGKVNIFWVKCKDGDTLTRFGQKIDELFANSPDETKSEDESTFIAGFIKAGGDFPGKLQIVSYVVLIAIVLVVANTMSLAFRERTRELAAFKALGFPNWWVMRSVVSESVAVTTVGGLLGIVPVYLACKLLVLKLPIPGMGRIVVPDKTAVTAVVVVLIVGLLAGILPAWQATRLKVVDALRKVG
jgi:putative ABC transport system permease protein